VDRKHSPGVIRVAGAGAGSGWFGFLALGFTGRLFDGPVRVFTSDRTRWVGLAGLDELAGGAPIRLRVVGLILKDPNTADPIVIARMVEAIN
jgi:hypothetical protein